MKKISSLQIAGLCMIFIGISFLFIFMFLSFPYWSQMAVTGLPWSDGFENDFEYWEGIEESPGNGSIISQTTIKNEGTKGARCQIFNQTAWTQAFCYQSFPEAPTVHVKAWFYINAYTSEGIIRTLLGMRGQGFKWYSIGINPDRTLYLFYYDGNSYETSSSTTAVPLGTGFDLEFMVTVSESAGQCKTWLNEVEVTDITKSGINCSLSGNMERATFGIHDGYRTNAEIFMDSCWISLNYIGSSTPPTPPSDYDLLVNSQPVTGISYSVDSQTATTGTLKTLTAGSYTITMPSTVTSGGQTYSFESWNDATTNPVKQIILNSDLSLTVTYELQTNVTPSEGNGFLEVHAYLDSSEVNAQCQVNGQQFETTTSGSTIELTAGNYILNVTYQSEMLTKDIAILEGQTIREDFQFGEPQPPDKEQPILFCIVGLALVALGSCITLKERRNKR